MLTGRMLADRESGPASLARSRQAQAEIINCICYNYCSRFADDLFHGHACQTCPSLARRFIENIGRCRVGSAILPQSEPAQADVPKSPAQVHREHWLTQSRVQAGYHDPRKVQADVPKSRAQVQREHWLTQSRVQPVWHDPGQAENWSWPGLARRCDKSIGMAPLHGR
jgi:hypothetical protein